MGSGEASGEGERGTYIENGERGSWRGEEPSYTDHYFFIKLLTNTLRSAPPKGFEHVTSPQLDGPNPIALLELRLRKRELC